MKLVNMCIRDEIYESVWYSLNASVRDSVYRTVDDIVYISACGSVYSSGWRSVGESVLAVFGGTLRGGIYNHLKNEISEYEY
jgi:hypothetical protein